MNGKQYKPGQIVTINGKKYRLTKTTPYNQCGDCQYAVLPITFYPCIWCVQHIELCINLQEIKPKHE